MFRIKVCGITTADDARAAEAAGADALGLNFYSHSPRYLDPRHAEAVVAAIKPRTIKVGLFVDASAEQILERQSALGLDLIQLHGNEPPELLTQLGPLPVMRAFRCGPAGVAPVASYLAECQRLNCLPRLVLIDAYRPGQFGGTGAVADWELVAEYHQLANSLPLVLAGGLDPHNVAEAIAQVRPAAVDVASGVELSPGRKDAEKMRQFAAAANDAFRRLSAPH